jgi:hypothetical protein
MSPPLPEGDNGLSAIQSETVTGDTASVSEGVKNESEYLDNQAKLASIEGQRQDIQERKHYARKLFWLTASWLIAVFSIVTLTAVKIDNPCWWSEYLPTLREIKLSEAVLLALIGTTTANVLGLFVIVARYLFPDSRGK